MRIAVTGGDGFIGRYLLQHSATGAEFHVLGRQPLERLDAGQASFPYHRTDYSYGHLCELLRGFDGVVHLASRRSAPPGDDRIGHYLENIMISDNLFRACGAASVTNVVNASSRCVYPNYNAGPLDETMREQPANSYGLSKLAVEKLAGLYNLEGMGIKSLRMGIVIGHGKQDGLMVKTFIERAAAGKPLEVYGTGADTRHYLYVLDAVRAIDAALARPDLAGCWNVAMERACSNLELAEAVNCAFGNEGNLVLRPDRQDAGERFCMDISRAERDLGVRPEWDMESALRDMRRRMGGGGSVT